MLINTISAALFASLAIASPAPIIKPRQNASDFSLKVTNFFAFMADPYIDGAQSNLSFHVVDPRPEYYAEIDCVVPQTYFNLYAISALYDWCGDGKLGFDYNFGETSITVRRGWWVDNATYLTGSGTQPTNWVDSGPAANVTSFPNGKRFLRESEWLFPVTRVGPGTPAPRF